MHQQNYPPLHLLSQLFYFGFSTAWPLLGMNCCSLETDTSYSLLSQILAEYCLMKSLYIHRRLDNNNIMTYIIYSVLTYTAKEPNSKFYPLLYPVLQLVDLRPQTELQGSFPYRPHMNVLLSLLDVEVILRLSQGAVMHTTTEQLM